MKRYQSALMLFRKKYICHNKDESPTQARNSTTRLTHLVLSTTGRNSEQILEYCRAVDNSMYAVGRREQKWETENTKLKQHIYIYIYIYIYDFY